MCTIAVELLEIVDEPERPRELTTTGGAPTRICSPSAIIWARFILLSDTPASWLPAALIASMAREP